MLPSHSSADGHIRRGVKRKCRPSRCASDSSQSSQQRRTKHCVQEGRWPDHAPAERGTAQPLLQTTALQLGLCGIGEREVRELGLWVYLQANEVHPQSARDEARTVLDTKLEAADMYQHLSFFRKVLPDTELSRMHDMLRNLICAREHEKTCCTLQSDGVHGQEGPPELSPGSLSELYAEFLEQHAQHTCRVSERRMRCIQLRQALRDAESVEAYPHVIYSQLWDKEEGAWSRFLHERDLDALWLPR